MERMIAALALLSLTVLGAGGHARAAAVENADPCTLVDSKGEGASSYKKLMHFLATWWNWPAERAAADEAQATGRAEDDIFFTLKSGYFVMPICTGDYPDGPDMRQWMPYPVGLLVKVIGSIHVRGVNYKLVETEYGLYTYVKPSDIKRLEPYTTYLFPAAAEPAKFCPGAIECSPEEEKNFWVRYNQYAILGEPFTSCGAYHAEIFRDGRSAGEVGYFNPCHEGTSDSHERRLKTTDLYEAKKIFDVSIRGVYLRLTPQLMAHIMPNTTDIRSCNEEITFELEGGGETKVGFKVPLYVFEWDGAADIATRLKKTFEDSKGTFSYYSPYTLDLGTRGRGTYVIEATSYCDELNKIPHKGYLLEIVHGRGLRGAITLKVDTLLEELQKTGKVRSLEYTIPEYLEEGQFWVIKDEIQYLEMLAVLRNVVADTHLRRDVVGDPGNRREWVRVVDFFAHLVLAATSYFDPEPAWSRDTMPPWERPSPWKRPFDESSTGELPM